jgi:hypothetical protein
VWRRLPWIPGVLLTLLIALPWYWLAEQRTPGFLEYFLIGEHWHRFVTPGWEGDRYGNAHDFPIGTIWGFAFIDILPWSILLPFAAWYWRKHNGAVASAVTTAAVRPDERAWRGYLLIWTITPLLFFTAARNIIMTYVLPGLPAAAILAGGWLAGQARRGRQVDRVLSAGLLVTLLLMVGLVIVDGEPSKLERKTLKPLLEAYDRARTQGPAATASALPADVPLIFVQVRPFSAEFYSRGRAVKVADANVAWQRIADGPAYVVVRDSLGFIASAPARGGAASNQTSVTRLGQYGDYHLLFVVAR